MTEGFYITDTDGVINVRDSGTRWRVFDCRLAKVCFSLCWRLNVIGENIFRQAVLHRNVIIEMARTANTAQRLLTTEPLAAPGTCQLQTRHHTWNEKGTMVARRDSCLIHYSNKHTTGADGTPPRRDASPTRPLYASVRRFMNLGAMSPIHFLFMLFKRCVKFVANFWARPISCLTKGCRICLGTLTSYGDSGVGHRNQRTGCIHRLTSEYLTSPTKMAEFPKFAIGSVRSDGTYSPWTGSSNKINSVISQNILQWSMIFAKTLLNTLKLADENFQRYITCNYIFTE